MKKILSIVAFLLLGMTLFAQVPSQVTELTFQVGYTDPTQASGEFPRGTVNPPSACLDDHTLFINGEHSDYTLYIVDTSDEEPDVVYQVVIPAGVNAVVLPATLSGIYELQLHNGGAFYFYAEIILS
jgi:hypothetical protein